MNNMKTKFCCICILSFCFFSCDFSYEKRLGESDYYLGWGIGKEYTDLAFGDEDVHEGIISARVTDVYWDDKYILVTQCKLYNDSITGYYIVKQVRYGGEKAYPNIFGPFSKEEYEKQKQELHLDERNMEHLNLFDSIFLFNF